MLQRCVGSATERDEDGQGMYECLARTRQMGSTCGCTCGMYSGGRTAVRQECTGSTCGKEIAV